MLVFGRLLGERRLMDMSICTVAKGFEETVEAEMITDVHGVQVQEVVVILEQRAEVEVEVVLLRLFVSAVMGFVMTLEMRMMVCFVLRLMELRRGSVELSEEVIHVEMETTESILIGRRGERLVTLGIVLTTFGSIAKYIVRFSDRPKGFFRFGILVLVRMILQR